MRPAVWVGLISYPLYLWHWVLLSLTVVMLGDADPIGMKLRKVACLVVSFGLAWLTWRYFEQPIRRQAGGKAALSLGVTVAMLGLGGLWVAIDNGAPDRPATFVSAQSAPYLASMLARDPRQRPCHTLEDKATWPDHWYCEIGDSSAKTWVAAYGDSHASRMLPALDKFGKTAGVRVVFASQSSCLPLLGIVVDAPTNGSACHELARNMADLADREQAAAAIFIQSWLSYIERPDRIRPDSGAAAKAQNADSVLAHALDATLSYYESRSIPVVLMQDNPHQSGLVPIYRIRFGGAGLEQRINQSAVSVAKNASNQAAVNKILETAASSHSMAHVLNIDSSLCMNGSCPWADANHLLYSDVHHLTPSGSLRVYPALSAEMIRALDESKKLVASVADRP